MSGKAIFINGSPRKNHNTHSLLENARRAAEDCGYETETVHLYDLNFRGCMSCFACKLKDSKTGGVCAVQDELLPVLERIMEADVLVIGTPIYFGNISGETQSFLERLLFPVLRYRKPEKGVRPRNLPKAKKVGLIVDMNVQAAYVEAVGYGRMISGITQNLETVLCDGKCEVLYSCDTYQFDDYSRYDVNMFSESAKRRQREKQFPKDLEKAYEMGKTLCG